MYPKHVTERIVELWAHGFSAEETRTALQEQYRIKPCLDTIYKKRHSLTAQDLIDELLRQQERDILKADSDDRELAMKYRNELLKILLPQRIEAISMHKEVVENRTVSITADFQQAIRNAVQRNLDSERAKQSLDTS